MMKEEKATDEKQRDTDKGNSSHSHNLCAIRVHLWLFTILITQASLFAAEPSKPNVVVFLADDMGWGDSATYGHKLIQTPNLDKLASQGVKFTQCYSACGVCSPSRSAILTGGLLIATASIDTCRAITKLICVPVKLLTQIC